DPDDLSGGSAGPARTDAAIGGDVPGAQKQRRTDTSLRRSPRAPRMGRASTPAVQSERGAGLVREVRDGPQLHLGEGTARSRRPAQHDGTIAEAARATASVQALAKASHVSDLLHGQEALCPPLAPAPSAGQSP